MKVYLIVIDDHHTDPEYLVVSTKEKAREAIRDIVTQNYAEDDGTIEDEYGRGLDECLDNLYYENGEDYVIAIDIEVDSLVPTR